MLQAALGGGAGGYKTVGQAQLAMPHRAQLGGSEPTVSEQLVWNGANDARRKERDAVGFHSLS
jgi:hypothetical protein